MTPSPSQRTDRTVHRLGEGGAVLDWLVSPVWDHPCAELEQVVDRGGEPWDQDGRPGRWRLTNGPDAAPVKTLLYERHPLQDVTALPTVSEGGAIAWPSPFPAREAPLEGSWERHRTGADGVIERSEFCYTPTYRVFAAACALEVDQPETRALRISSTGPVQVWLGGRLVLDHREFGYMQPWTRDLETLLPSGTTELVIASWNIALREVRQTLSVQIVGLPVRVVLPSRGADEARDAAAERLLDGISVRQWETGEDSFVLHGPAGARVRVSLGGMPASPVTFDGSGQAVVPIVSRDADSSQASMLGTGELTASVRVDDEACPSHRRLLVGYLPWRSRQAQEGTPEQWRSELLEHVASRSGSARCLARHAISPDPGHVVALADLQTALRFITTRCDCADFEAVGLMLLWHRVPESRWEPSARAAVTDALLGFKYWIDQPGCDAMCYFTENHQMVWHTAETLVGEAFPDDKFSNTGWSGREHAEHGRQLAREWIARKLVSGFSEFDSNAYLAIDALALVALVDHAQDEGLARAAEALLDKILFTLAANSWRGTHGSAHGRSYTPTLRASCLEETAPIMWLCWGMGALNEATLPATALATSPAYRLPEAIGAIASDPDTDWSGSQAYSGSYAFERDLLARPYSSHVLVRRGPGGMVSSVQDYRPGLPGLQEHVWGITLPGQVQVWATNPAALNHGPHTRPSAWVGHRVLPRVRQHDRTVIALHRPEACGVHLWFPCARLDQWRTHGDWLVGHKGEGLVAVAASGGWTPDRSGDEAWQRWEPRDGSALVAVQADTRAHESLEAFAGALPALDFHAHRGPGVVIEPADGPRLELDWDGPFLVDGAPADLAEGLPAHPAHLDNPACHLAASETLMEAAWRGHRLRLDLEAGRRLEPASSRDEER